MPLLGQAEKAVAPLTQVVAATPNGWDHNVLIGPFGETLVIDWGTLPGGIHVFCAVLAWSRYRFVRAARDQQAATTMRLLAECFEVLGGVPKVVLADRMGKFIQGARQGPSRSSIYWVLGALLVVVVLFVWLAYLTVGLPCRVNANNNDDLMSDLAV